MSYFLEKPVFVVGHPRSGTTLLATVLGRNSDLAMPPETQFFIENGDIEGKTLSHAQFLQIIRDSRVKDLRLEESRLVEGFSKSDGTAVAAFAAILEQFRKRIGKGRVGEKSPLHLLHARFLLESFPGSKVVCIERNGADVISSLMRMPWSHRNFRRHVFDWRKSINHALHLEVVCPDRFKRVSFEGLTREPEQVVKEICQFCELQFQPEMIQAGVGETVPEWERGWKSRASQQIVDKEPIGEGAFPFLQRAIFRTFAGRAMAKSGHESKSPNILEVLAAWVVAWPYHPGVHPRLRKLKSKFGA